VSFPKAKTPERLYNEVESYDLIITPDGPLASALNRQLDQPHLGPFAIPPRRLAAGRREKSEDRLAFLDIIEHDDISWKQIAYAIGNILQCWEHQGSHNAILEYDAYVDDATERAVKRIADIDTASMELTIGNIDPNQDVVIVGFDMLTQLERSFLPDEYYTVDLFTDDPFELPEFRILDSTTAIVDAVINSVSVKNAENVAIVLDQNSEYSPLVESALEAAGIPFFGGPGFSDLAEHRAFLQLLRTAFRGTETLIEEIRPLLATLNIDLDIAHEEKRLYQTEAPELVWLTDFCRKAETYTFGEALTAFKKRANCELETFRDELDTLSIANEPVTEHGVDQLSFYLQSYEVPVNRENEGVLLADAKSAAFVGRDVVFFLGLDEDWTHSPPRRPWVDQQAQYTRNIQGFQLLLQSGSKQHYLVQNSTGGSPVTPCLYFEELLEQEYDRFSDLPSTTHSQRSDLETPTAFEKTSASVSTESVETISQSSLSTYVNSPRDYYFSRLVESPDKDYFTEGNLFHDFAEFYVNHPEFVDSTVIEETVEFMLEEARPLMRSVDEETRRTEYRIGLKTIIFHLGANPPTDDSFLTPSTGRGTNIIADYFDRTVDSPVTERRFDAEDLGINGVIDLVQSRIQLTDFKSGSKKSARDVVKHSSVDDPTDEPNFQALLYLTYWRSKFPDERLKFTFFHFLETVDDAIVGEVDIEDTLTTVTYYPTSPEEYVNREEFFEYLLEDGANKCQKILSKIDYEAYDDLFEVEKPPKTTDSNELIESAFGQQMIDQLEDIIGEYKYVTTGSKQAMREMTRVWERNYFESDLDAFETFIQDRLTELDRRLAGDERFPVEGLAGEPNYRYVDNRDLLLEGER